MKSFFEDLFNRELIRIKDFSYNVEDLFILIAILVVIKIISVIVKKIIYKHSKREKGNTYAVYKLISYFIWIFGVIFYLKFIGVDITLLIAGSAALLVGVGIGLQQTFNDLISGFILLFEGSIKIDDIVLIDGEFRRITKIGLRTSRALGYDNAVHIVPNSKIVTERVINYDYNYDPIRFQVKLGVAYGSDIELVREVLLKLANEDDEVLTEPEPFVMFDEFGESSFNFRLGFYVTDTWSGFQVQSKLRFKIDKAFKENGITIAFPQRDLHIKSSNIDFGKRDGN